MTADLHYFPISREVADRLGSRGRLEAHPFANGEAELTDRSAHQESLMEEARRENERLKWLIGSAEPLPPPRIEIERFSPRTTQSRQRLTAEMVSEGKRESATRLEPYFNFGPVDFGPTISFRGASARFKFFIRHLFAPRHASEPSMRAQPRLHHGNPSPDFPPDPPSGVRRDECGGGGGGA